MIPDNTVLLVFLGLINISGFLVMVYDKAKSVRQGNERIPEGVLFFIAAIGGAVGIYAGMFTARHKTRRWYFLIGIPILIAQNYLALMALEKSLTGV